MIKNISIKIAFIGTALFSLTACEPSVDSLAKDHEKRREILNECYEKGIESRHEERCKNAAEAEVKALKNDINDAVKSLED